VTNCDSILWLFVRFILQKLSNFDGHKCNFLWRLRAESAEKELRYSSNIYRNIPSISRASTDSRYQNLKKELQKIIEKLFQAENMCKYPIKNQHDWRKWKLDTIKSNLLLNALKTRFMKRPDFNNLTVSKWLFKIILIPSKSMRFVYLLLTQVKRASLFAGLKKDLSTLLRLLPRCQNG
jgi:hypothetical protein